MWTQYICLWCVCVCVCAYVIVSSITSPWQHQYVYTAHMTKKEQVCSAPSCYRPSFSTIRRTSVRKVTYNIIFSLCLSSSLPRILPIERARSHTRIARDRARPSIRILRKSNIIKWRLVEHTLYPRWVKGEFAALSSWYCYFFFLFFSFIFTSYIRTPLFW